LESIWSADVVGRLSIRHSAAGLRSYLCSQGHDLVSDRYEDELDVTIKRISSIGTSGGQEMLSSGTTSGCCSATRRATWQLRPDSCTAPPSRKPSQSGRRCV